VCVCGVFVGVRCVVLSLTVCFEMYTYFLSHSLLLSLLSLSLYACIPYIYCMNDVRVCVYAYALCVCVCVCVFCVWPDEFCFCFCCPQSNNNMNVYTITYIQTLVQCHALELLYTAVSACNWLEHVKLSAR